MKKKGLIIFTLFLIGIIDYLGSRSFEFYNSRGWFPTFYFLLIGLNFIFGYNYWKREAEKWVLYIWNYIYVFIFSYYIFFWALYMMNLSSHNFLFKTYIHIGLSPLTFGFVYLIRILSKVKNETPLS